MTAAGHVGQRERGIDIPLIPGRRVIIFGSQRDLEVELLSYLAVGTGIDVDDVLVLATI